MQFQGWLTCASGLSVAAVAKMYNSQIVNFTKR